MKKEEGETGGTGDFIGRGGARPAARGENEQKV